MNIIIDPGHGGPDTGTRDPATGLTESYAAFVTSLTLKFLAEQDGHTVFMTRIDDRDVDNFRRATMYDGSGDVFVSVHYDWPQGRRLIYYPAFHDESRQVKFGVQLGEALDVRAIPSTSSRFGRLYIDDCDVPAVLWEVDRISDMQPTKEYRVGVCEEFLQALYATFNKVW